MKPALEKWVGDLRHAGRSLLRAPGFTLIVVATLALAIGANTAIFSVVNVVLLKPLPFPHADRLVHIGGTAPGTDQPEELGVPDELYFEYRESVPGARRPRPLRHRFVHDTSGGPRRPALRYPGDTVLLHDVGCPAAARAGPHRCRRRPRRGAQSTGFGRRGSTPISR